MGEFISRLLLTHIQGLPWLTDKTAITAADLLNDRHSSMDKTLCILTDRGTEYCGKPENHAYQLYLGIENILEPNTTDQCHM